MAIKRIDLNVPDWWPAHVLDYLERHRALFAEQGDGNHTLPHADRQVGLDRLRRPRSTEIGHIIENTIGR